MKKIYLIIQVLRSLMTFLPNEIRGTVNLEFIVKLVKYFNRCLWYITINIVRLHCINSELYYPD